MSGNRSYGDMLRMARERNGLDIVAMSRRLHIRPDILKAIEQADFMKMPARGYSRNMIRAYARQVGLDENELSERYLDEIHMFETGSARVSPRGAGGYIGRSSARDREPDDNPLFDSYSFNRPRRSQRISDAPYGDSRNFNRRSSYQDDSQPPYGRASQRVSRSRQLDGQSQPMRGRGVASQRSSRSLRLANQDRQRYQSQSSRFQEQANSSDLRSIRFRSGGNNRATNLADRRAYSLPQLQDSFRGAGTANRSGSPSYDINIPVLVLVGVIAIALIIGIVVLFNGSRTTVDEVPNIPISGLTDTSSPEDEEGIVAPSTAPVFVAFQFSVEAGEESWIEIYEDDNDDPTFADVVEGPYTKSYDVTGTLTIQTANPTPVRITVDGTAVDFRKVSGTNYYSYTVDFNEILADWYADNNADGSTSATGGSSANRTNSARANSNSASNSFNSSNSSRNSNSSR